MRREVAVLFDVDGTLTDSNYLHVDAWSRALAQAGLESDDWRIHRAIGLDSELFVRHLHPDVDDEGIEAATTLHSAFYKETWPRVRPVAGARELIRTLHERGFRVVLATSAPSEELDMLREVLAVDECLYATTNADDVDTAKPDPDILDIAVQRAGVERDATVMIGDSVWDGEASRKAGVTFIGLRSGGIGEQELRDAGAVEIYDDPLDLLHRLSTSVIAGMESP